MVSASARPLLIVLSVCLLPTRALTQTREQEIPASLEAARQRAAMPSPLDKLDAAAIPSLERFDWQPKELVAILGEHRGRQGHLAQSVAFSPDGKLVASGGGDGRIRIWDRATMRQRHLLGTSYGVARVVFFADGKTMAACTAAATVQLWDMTGKEPKAAATLQKGSTAYYALAVAHDGKHLVAGGADSAVRVWSLGERGEKLMVELFNHSAAVTGLAFAPDGKMFASSSSDGTIRLWAINADKVVERNILRGHKDAVTCVAFSDGGTLASGGSDGTVRLWNLNPSPPREKTVIPTGTGAVTALAFGPKGSGLIAAAHADYIVHVWTLGNTPRQKSLLEGHAGHIYDVAFAPAKTRIHELATASGDWTVRLWGAGPKPRDKTIKHGHWSHTYTVDFAPDAKRLVSGSYDTSLRMWDLDGKAPKEQLVWKKDPVQTYALAFSPDGTGVAYGGADTTVRLWEPEKRWIARKFAGHPGQVTAVAYSPNGKQLLTCSLNSIRLYDVASGRAEREIKGHTKTVNSIAFSPDGRYALSGAGAYEYKDNQILVVNGKVVYADCTTRLWDVDNGKELFNIKDQEVPVLCVAYCPDGRRIAYSLQDSVIRLYDVTDAKPGKMTNLKGTAYGYGYWAKYSPDGKMLVTVGVDGKVIVWDTATGQRLREWTFNEVTYRAVFAPDSRHLAIPLGTGVVYVLRLPQK